MSDSRRPSPDLFDHLVDYDRVVEVGIGRRPDLGARLARAGVAVTATDVHRRPTPEGVRFVRDDVLEPDPSVYADADAVYARNLPPELHRPARDVAREAAADFLFTTLGGDQPAVPVERRTIREGTLYVAAAAGPP
ncbi:UPF0146 family protein [Halopiger goleimassiliensis]|uniref:UPF0146 family protein n=1 Tax=Halopiger goleimassiliensis TaxID=1293048 RepID=UPI000A6D3972|nr:UPF0146 family protein [Halopiger goleimassiliensis]